jgi:hypothetical protein
MFFRLPPGARWNPDRNIVEFGIGVGEYESVVRVSKRVFQILVPDAPTPERCVKPYHIQRTRLELIAEGKFRRRLLTDDAMSRSPVAICGSGRSHPPDLFQSGCSVKAVQQAVRDGERRFPGGPLFDLQHKSLITKIPIWKIAINGRVPQQSPKLLQ